VSNDEQRRGVSFLAQTELGNRCSIRLSYGTVA